MEGRLGQLNNLSEKVIQYEVAMGRMNSQFQNFERERAEFENVSRENENLKKKVG